MVTNPATTEIVGSTRDCKQSETRGTDGRNALNSRGRNLDAIPVVADTELCLVVVNCNTYERLTENDADCMLRRIEMSRRRCQWKQSQCGYGQEDVDGVSHRTCEEAPNDPKLRDSGGLA